MDIFVLVISQKGANHSAKNCDVFLVRDEL